MFTLEVAIAQDSIQGVMVEAVWKKLPVLSQQKWCSRQQWLSDLSGEIIFVRPLGAFFFCDLSLDIHGSLGFWVNS